ncbi:hypothetical protein [Polaribacter sp. Asnod1-A03]|uniref:hypothetical protein n=1 Tax=Polaribacter sp. Asnod1-A03 TaxID=3160581 RepID=UPI00386D3024
MNFFKKVFSIICFFLLILPFRGQDLFKGKNIDSSFINYTQRPREIAYAHLNKSTFIVGEDIGFTTYVINNQTNSFSSFATNLYCIIKDKDDKIIKKQLIKVENGVAHNTISIDSLFTSGEYKFIAFTNWIRNFKEHNYFAETIRIIDPQKEIVIKNETISNKIDAQFLPESGHLLANTENKVGIIVKNELGYGISNIIGDLLDERKLVVTSFKVNKLGIGSFIFTPKINKKYTAKISYNDNEYLFPITSIERKGITLSVKRRSKGISIFLNTNQLTLKEIKRKPYFISIHNGKEITKYPISFDTNLSIEEFINPFYLSNGINIITLFNNNNNPIAERLFFNYDKIKLVKINTVSVQKIKDSTLVTLNFNNAIPNSFNNISISILPTETKSYKHHHNILSYYYLKPYLKGVIENGKYYFSNITEQTKKDLDNLLITQGWSSYNWYDIFNNNNQTKYFIEDGISVKVKVRNNKESKYVIHPVGKQKPNYYVLNENENQFLAFSLFPKSDEKVRLSSINEKGILKPLTSYLAFYPKEIPKLKPEYTLLSPKRDFYIKSNLKNSFYNSTLNKTQQLDEVIIKSKMNETRTENIKRRTFGKVHIFSDIDRKRDISFLDYIRNKGYAAVVVKGIVTIKKSSEANTIYGGNTPTIYLNGAQLFGFSDLTSLDMSEVEYIDINKHGIGEGIRGGAGGVIRIKTNSNLQYKTKKTITYRSYPFPLTFTTPKKYYTPIYQSYRNLFFSEYGVINWFPINNISKNGAVNFKIEKNKYDSFKVLIEGFSGNGNFIFEEKTINLEK